jgi:8-oxo-dGTP pyrophosphatase MutT (NUDIX family)
MLKDMVRYVVGLMFSEDSKMVLMIEKQRPEWQKGFLNGVGGHVEPGEELIDRMIEEFKEETAIITQADNWTHSFTLSGSDWMVDFYYSFNDLVYQFRTITDERLILLPVDRLSEMKTLPDLQWSIPMILQLHRDKEALSTPVTSNLISSENLEAGKKYLIEVGLRECGNNWMKCQDCKTHLEFMLGYQIVCVSSVMDGKFYSVKSN